MRRWAIVALVILAVSCSPKIVLQKDTVSVINTEYREILRDTVIYVSLPQERVSVQTKDTLSVLETDVAASTARVSGGVLSHSLSTKDYRPEVVVQYKDIVHYRDSTILVKSVDVQYKEKELTGWQKFCIKSGLVLWLAIIIALGYLLVRRLIG